MKIGPRIRKLRKKNNLSVEQLAKELKVEPSKVEKWETNEEDVSSYTASSIARILHVSMKELTGEDIKMQEEHPFKRFGKMYLENLLIIGAILIFYYIMKYLTSAVN